MHNLCKRNVEIESRKIIAADNVYIGYGETKQMNDTWKENILLMTTVNIYLNLNELRYYYKSGNTRN